MGAREKKKSREELKEPKTKELEGKCEGVQTGAAWSYVVLPGVFVRA